MKVRVYAGDTADKFALRVCRAYEKAGDISGSVEWLWAYDESDCSDVVEVIELLESYDDSIRIIT